MWIPQFLRGVFPNSLTWCCFLAFMLFACLNAVSLLWCRFLVFMPFPCFDAVSLLSCFWCHFCWWSEKWKKKNHRIWKRASPVSTPWFRDNHLPLVNRMALPKWFSKKQPQAVFGEEKKKKWILSSMASPFRLDMPLLWHQTAYLLGLLAMIKCSICSYQCDNWYSSNRKIACHANFSVGRLFLELARGHLACCPGIALC